MIMNRQVKSFLMPGVLCAALLLTGCAGTALGEWNQKISDAAHSLASGGSGSSSEGSMPWMARAGISGPGRMCIILIASRWTLIPRQRA